MPFRKLDSLGRAAMHYVIRFNLGSEAEEQIRSLWRTLGDQRISTPELASDGTPHVTLMSSASVALASITKDLDLLAGQFAPFEITFSHIGFFPGRPLVLFLGVTHTATLTSLHRRRPISSPAFAPQLAPQRK